MYQSMTNLSFLVAQIVKNLLVMQETWVQSLSWEDPLEKGMGLPTPVFLPREFHGQRSLVGYSPRVCKGLDTTELLSNRAYIYSLSYYHYTIISYYNDVNFTVMNLIVYKLNLPVNHLKLFFKVNTYE